MFRPIRTSLALLTALAMTALVAGRVFGSRSGSDDPERGDVPGWVMITMMSAVLVAAILAVAQPALTTMFNDAIAKVGR